MEEGFPARRVIVVNNTWQIAPWADAVFAMDCKWWREYSEAVRQGFNGERLTITHHGHALGACRVMDGSRPMNTYGNSGSGAIALAILRGAAKILLLGYDCMDKDGQRHWHADHPSKLGNAGSLPRWPKQFACLRNAHPRACIVNCTRQTALQAFPRASLEDLL